MSTAPSRPVLFSRRRAIGLLGVGAGLGLAATLRDEPGPAAAWQAGAAGAKPVFPKGAIIRTILKDVPPEALGNGATIFHEHLSMEVPHPYVQWCEGPKTTTPTNAGSPPYCRPKEAQAAHVTEDVERIVEEVRASAKNGVSCILDGGGRDLGRNIEHLRTIAARSGVYIVASGGFHSHPMYPTSVAALSEDELAEELVRDARAERWGAFGEIGSSMVMQPDEKKVFRAISKAHLRTGLPIFTHTDHAGCPQCALDQVAIFESLGVNMRQVCIGHLSDIQDDPRAELHIGIAKRGAFIGFDSVGRPQRMAAHVEMTKAIIAAGYADRLVFGDDGVSENQFKSKGGPGWANILINFIPKLREAGVPDETLHMMTVDNPRRFLAHLPKTA